MAENEESEQTEESNENSEQESSDIIIPENIEINIDETNKNIDGGVTDSSEENSESIENIVESTSFIPTFKKGEVNPFLDAESVSNSIDQPVTNLEENIFNSQSQNARARTIEEEQRQQGTYNAPQYGTNYNTESYQEFHRQADTQRDISGGALTTRETEIPRLADRRIDFNRWQHENVNMFDQQERYQIGELERLKQDTELPFEKRKEKRPRF